MRASIAISIARGMLASAVLTLASGSCGRVAEEEELQIDSNTNWQIRCQSDDQCSGSLRCYCGQCTQPCAATDECGLLANAVCARADEGLCSGEPPTGGLCVFACSADEQCGADFTCSEARCVPKACSPQLQSWDDLMRLVSADLRSLDAADRSSMRYISLANHGVYSACDGTLTRERHALDKLLNSLSLSSVVSRARQIDLGETLYRIDLRDYDWNRLVRVGDTDYSDAWEALAQLNPFAVRLSGAGDAIDAATDTGTAVPVMFADSFVATAIQPELYAALVGIPSDYALLLEELGIDRAQHLPPKSRAGSSGSTESIATRFSINTYSGYLWEIADLGDPSARLMDDPLRDPAGERAVIFTLPNGLQAFAYMGSDDRWLPRSAISIDADTDNFLATAPLTLLRQHSPRVDLRDDVSNYVRSGPDAYHPDTLATILDLYMDNAELTAQLERDADEFVRSALGRAGISLAIPEPIAGTADAYAADVTLTEAAGALLVSQEALLEAMDLLPPELAVLDGGALDREDFALLYHEALCTLSVVNENRPDPVTCD